MKKIDNIEKLFKDKLSNYKADVPADVWQGLQTGLQAGAGSAASGGAAAGASIGGKIAGAIAAAVVVAGTVAGVVFFKDDNTVQNETISRTNQQTQEPVETNTEINPVDTEVNDDQKVDAGSENKLPDSNKKPGNQLQSEVLSKNGNEQSEDFDENPKSADNQNNESQLKGNENKQANQNAGKSEKPTQKEITQPGSAENVAQKIANNEFVPVTTVTPAGGTAPLVVELSCQGELKRAKWDFGDDTPSSDEQFTTHEYTKPGTYVIHFTGQKNNDEIFTESAQVKVEAPVTESKPKEELPPALINVPNVFTPNGDGINDVLKVTAENAREYTLKVYNRGGQIVFESKDKNEVWDGSDKSGNSLPSGIYFYQLRVKGNDGNYYHPKGSIQLTR